MNEWGMTFLNDGKTMTSDTETGMGTVEAIMYIEGEVRRMRRKRQVTSEPDSNLAIFTRKKRR